MSVNCIGHRQDADFVYKVRIMLPKYYVVMYVKLLLTVGTCCVDMKSTKLLSRLV
jgi:hypothetical protein